MTSYSSGKTCTWLVKVRKCDVMFFLKKDLTFLVAVNFNLFFYMFKLFGSGNLASNSLLKGVNKHDFMVLKFYQFWLQYLEIKVLKCLKDVFC